MNEVITVGNEKYTVTNIQTGLNTISFMLPDLTADEAESAFRNAESLTVGDAQDNIYGKYPYVVYESVTKDAASNVSVTMHVLTQEQVQIKELQISQGEQDEVIAEILYGGGEA